ncbi:MAG: hypothetical protein J1F16_00250 [Muribaculaceae bacterium]|nr:hypothetical protein [Muribaculaceae bacterium]
MKYNILSLLLAGLFWSCADRNEVPVDTLPEDDKISVIDVYTVSRAGEDPTDTEEGDTDGEPTEEDLITSQIKSVDFKEGAVLYVSQMGKTLNPYFPDGYTATEGSGTTPDSGGDTGDEGGSGGSGSDGDIEDVETNTLYTYLYKENRNADWDNFFNFYPIEGTEYLEWSAIRQRGAVGNGYSLFAFYFPQDNQIHFGVEQDQSDPINLLKSNVLGAYHSSSTLFSRLRFRLFHLMIYLKVTLYVPIYDADDNSGYLIDGFQDALVLNPMTDYSISWRVIRSSDIDPPFVQPDPKSHVESIIPYSPTVVPESTTIETGTYKPGETIETDNVYKYTFHVILPPQGTNFSNGVDFLQFRLKTPGGTEKYYYFNDSQFAGLAEDEFTFNQGTYQNLELYLPRKGNETILVKAKVNDWNQVTSQMPVFDSDPPSNN